MLILGIESSSITASAAILRDGMAVAEYTVNFKKTHSQTLLPMIDEIVCMTQTRLEELDAIAISAGPGSFTGLRIGSATAKGLGLALGKPVVEVSTLEAMAACCFGFDGLVCPIIDARREQLYCAAYRVGADGLPKAVLEPEIRLAAELKAELDKLSEKVVFTGDGLEKYWEFFSETETAVRAPAVCRNPRAAAVAMLGAAYFEQGRVVPASEHRPIYLKKTQAESQREAGIYTKGSTIPT